MSIEESLKRYLERYPSATIEGVFAARAARCALPAQRTEEVPVPVPVS